LEGRRHAMEGGSINNSVANYDSLLNKIAKLKRDKPILFTRMYYWLSPKAFNAYTQQPKI
jgi:hypothetical protein